MMSITRFGANMQQPDQGNRSIVLIIRQKNHTLQDPDVKDGKENCRFNQNWTDKQGCIKHLVIF